MKCTYNIEKVNEALVRITSDDSGALMDLSEQFTFYADGYKFVPSYRNKLWDGKIRLWNSRYQTLPYGLMDHAVKFAIKAGYTVDFSDELKESEVPTKKECLSFIENLKISLNGKKITPRDYQVESFLKIVREGRVLIVSPTGSGKSLIIYLAIRWFLENGDGKIIVVVPTTSLVEQMTKDFQDYSSKDDEFDVDLDVHKIYSGKEKFNIDAGVVVTTWQSAIKLPKDWFKQFGMAIGDEAHLFKAKSLNTIMGNLVNASYRIGATGTLDDSVCNELTLTGNFGPVFNTITTKELIENKTLAKLSINCIVCNHDDNLKKVVSKMDYKSEIATIVEHPQRNSFISNLACDQKGNTLILFNYVKKHGKPLYEMIKEKAGDDRSVFYVSGEVKTEDRERVRELTEKETGVIIVASSQVFSTGINIKELHNIIFAAPTKSQVRVLQSIGRGLRRSKHNKDTIVYDIADDFSWKKKINHTMRHAKDRISIYTKQGFDYKIHKIELPYDET